eukprot:363879-Chlamydomonas_euryale.AAC.7
MPNIKGLQTCTPGCRMHLGRAAAASQIRDARGIPKLGMPVLDVLSSGGKDNGHLPCMQQVVMTLPACRSVAASLQVEASPRLSAGNPAWRARRLAPGQTVSRLQPVWRAALRVTCPEGARASHAW